MPGHQDQVSDDLNDGDCKKVRKQSQQGNINYISNEYKYKSSHEKIVQYETYFKQIKAKRSNDFPKMSIQLVYDKLRENKLIINQPTNSNNHQFLVNVIKRSKNGQILQIDCRLHIYQKRFVIFNNQKNISKNHLLGNNISGGNGCIYKCMHSKNCVAVKCFQYDLILINKQIIIKSALHQLFFGTIMSALKIGPKIQSFYGFDLIINQNCIQFAMESCQNSYTHMFNSQNQLKLKQELCLMHQLNIVHSDIKTLNIMYSNSYKKFVFIDYGTSQILNQKVGFKTYTSFKGTALHCSQQMLKCVKGESFVDLYVNDVICLKKAVQKLYNNTKNTLYAIQNFSINQNNDSKQKCQFQLVNLQLKLDFLLFKQSLQQIRLFLLMIQLKSFFQLQHVQLKILKYFIQICPTQIIYQFCLQNLSYKAKNTYNFKKFLRQYQLQSRNLIYNLPQQNLQKLFIQNDWNNQKEIQTFQSKKSVNRLLLQNQNYVDTDVSIYIKFYLKYISFTNNIYHCNLQERYEASMAFLSFQNQTKFLSFDEVCNFFKPYKNFTPNQKYLSKQMIVITKGFKICIAFIALNIQKFYDIDFVGLIKDLILLNFNFYQLQRLFLNVLIKISKNNFLQQIKNCLQLSFGVIGLIEIRLIKPFQQQTHKPFNNRKFYQDLRIEITNQLTKSRLNQQICSKKFDLINEVYKTCYNLLFLVQQKKYYHYVNVISNNLKRLKNLLRNNQHLLSSNQSNLVQEIIIQISHKYLSTLSQQDFFITYLQAQNLYQEYKQFYKKRRFQLMQIDFWFIRMACSLKNYKKIKNQFQLIDLKINCQQISQPLLISHRLASAFLQQDQVKVNKLISSIFINSGPIDLRNYYIYVSTFLTIRNSLIDSIITKNQFNKSLIEDIIRQNVDKLTKMVFEIQENHSLTTYYNFVMALSKEYFVIDEIIKSSNLQFKEKIIIRLKKIDQRIKILESKFKIPIIRFTFIDCLIFHYMNYANPSFQNIKLALDYLKEFSKNKMFHIGFHNFIIVYCKILKFKMFLIKKYEFDDFLNLFYLIKFQNYTFYYMDAESTLNVFFILTQRSLFDQLINFLSNLIQTLKRSFSKCNFQFFLQFLDKAYQNCGCTICQQKYLKIQNIHQKIDDLLIYKKRDVWEYAYFSIILSKRLSFVIYQQQIVRDKFLKVNLLFIVKSFYYLNFIAKQFLLQTYYGYHSWLHLKEQKKYKKTMKKHVKFTKNVINLQQINKFYEIIKRHKQRFNLNKQKLSQKIVKMHKNAQNFNFQQSQYCQKILQKKQDKDSYFLISSNMSFQQQKQILSDIQIVIKQFQPNKVTAYKQ